MTTDDLVGFAGVGELGYTPPLFVIPPAPKVPGSVELPGVEDATVSADVYAQLVVEYARRMREGLRVYRPTSVYTQAFHESHAGTRILRGGNRSGKTTAAAVEVARAITNSDPHGKYPKTGTAYLVAFDGRQVADVLYAKLFRPRSIEVIRDAVTGLYRPWTPDEPGDYNRRSEVTHAEPLVPERLVKKIAWENAGESIPSVIELTTGWTLRFFSSKARPERGTSIDLAWLDEEIDNRDWVPELRARLMQRSGKLIWSATPQSGTDQLYELSERAELELHKFQAGGPEPTHREWLILMKDNPYISERSQKEFADSLMTEEERRVRIDGQFSLGRSIVFPEWTTVDKCPWFPLVHVSGDLNKCWTLYAFTDPGRQVCATIFLAVPPPSEPDQRPVIYDELYVPQCDADKFGRLASERVRTYGTKVQAWYVDSHESRKHDTGGGKTVGYHYLEALRKYDGLPLSGSGFRAAPDTLASGLESLRTWLVRDIATGNTGVRIVAEKLPHLDFEMRRYRMQTNPRTGMVLEKPIKKNDHLIDCCRYAAAVDPVWKRPAPIKDLGSAAYRAFRAYRKARGLNGKRPSISFGPSQN